MRSISSLRPWYNGSASRFERDECRFESCGAYLVLFLLSSNGRILGLEPEDLSSNLSGRIGFYCLPCRLIGRTLDSESGNPSSNLGGAVKQWRVCGVTLNQIRGCRFA